ncbi:MAG TPA: diguanylate cyclase [Bryobacteraceae bacterium]|nr:diguanylate cyclase [Bryobacteraceae bacterium]
MWVGTESEVWLWRDAHFRRVTFDREIQLDSPGALAIGPGGDLWVASPSGLFRVLAAGAHSDALRAVLMDNSAKASYAGVAFDKAGSLWIAGAETISHWSPAPFRRLSTFRIPPDSWSTVLVDGHGTVWLRSMSRLLRLRAGGHRFEPADAGLPNAEVPALAMDPGGEILVPTIFGLARRASGGWQMTGRRNGLLMDSVSSVVFDRDGSPWIGLSGAGVAHWLGFGAWEAWTAPDWMADDAIWSIAEDAKGRIWLGANNGVLQLPPTYPVTRARPTPRFDIRSPVHALAAEPRNWIWVGTNRQGLFRCRTDSSTCQHYGADAGIPSRQIETVLLDAARTLWVGSNVGLFSAKLTQGAVHFAQVSLPSGTPLSDIPRIALDSRGEIVIAVRGAFWRRTQNGWRQALTGKLLPDRPIDRLMVDRDGNAWVSFMDNLGVWTVSGLFTAQAAVQRFDLTAGLPSNLVYALASDSRGRIFVATDCGIEVREHGSWRHYGMNEGLIWNDINTSALTVDSRGSLWIGTGRGVSHFQPDRQSASSPSPVPIVAGLEIAGQEQKLSGPIAVPYNRRDVRIRFSALPLASEYGLKFEYRLLGLNNSWTTANDADVQFINLAPGSYSLELRVKRMEGPASPQAARVQFVVATPWWRSTIFHLLSIAAALAIARAVWMWRIRSLLAQQRHLELAVQARTRELTLERQQLIDTREALRQQAIFDPLTKTLNRRALFELLEARTDCTNSEAQPLAIVMADVDHFKAINDRFGHQTGDLVLSEIADCFLSGIRASDAVGRYGGEELLVILDGCDLEEAGMRAEDLRLRVETTGRAMHLDGLAVTCSFGVSATRAGSLTMRELIAAADAALYESKRCGRNRVTLAPRPSSGVSIHPAA